MARHQSNLVQRNRIFHFRRGIPLELRDRFRRRELTCSLRTSDPHMAELRARQLYLASETVFEECRCNPSTTIGKALAASFDDAKWQAFTTAKGAKGISFTGKINASLHANAVERLMRPVQNPDDLFFRESRGAHRPSP